jgi:HD-GYP domain-containing protein (c-di-GMP phosphodiesterase class II)
MTNKQRQSFNSLLESNKYNHALNTAYYALILGHHMNLTFKELELLYYCAYLHDVGKNLIPLSLLQKKEKLTEKEIEIINKHTLLSQDILQDYKDINFMKDIQDVCLNHHNSPKTHKLSLYCKITQVCDVLDVLTSKRAYNVKITLRDAIKEIFNNIYLQFDKEIVNYLVKAYEHHAFAKIEAAEMFNKIVTV